MADIEKVRRGIERCLKHTCPSVYSKEYEECEYTVGLHCGQDRLLWEVLDLLKEQEAEIRQLRLALDIVKGTCKGIVVETDEKFMGDL